MNYISPRADAQHVSSGVDFASLMASVAIELLGQPTERHHDGKEWRYGTRGSLCVRIDQGTYFDNEAGAGGGTLDLIRSRTSLDKPGALAWLRERKLIEAARPEPGRSKIVATYDYRDAAGGLAFQVVRFEPKDFRQRRPDGKGGWVWKMQGVRLVPFRLPETVDAISSKRTVYIAEGEKGVNALVSIGLAATCSPGGAGKWRADYNRHFAGADVVILPDNDPQAKAPDGALRRHPDGRPVLPGQDHASDVAKHLAGIAARVRVVMLPGLPPKGDVADWIAAGGTAERLGELTATATTEIREEQRGRNSAPDAEAEPPEWAQHLQRDDRSEALNNLANALTAMRSAPELSGCFAYDQMQRAAILVKPVPKGRDDLPRPVQDGDVSQVQEWLQRHDLRRVGKDTTHQAVDCRAEENAFHPVRDYLNGLKWDKTPRLYSWLHHYLGTEMSDYTSGIGTMFLVSMVARIFRPGAKVDYMLILEGAQGAGKSTAGAILGGAWFSDSLPDIGSDAVRLAQHLRGKWLIEIGELSAMGKAEAEELKSFITRQEECFTPKYGRREVREPRQCVFLGTTNRAAYLRDETGARRFWPVKVGTIDTARLARDRDQLFAEAVHQFQRGVRWWPDAAFEAEHIRPQQAARHEDDAWQHAIADWPIAAQRHVTILQVARDALHIETAKLGTADQRRIAAALERLGWRRRQGKINGVQHWEQIP